MKKILLFLAIYSATPLHSYASAPHQCGESPSVSPSVALEDVNPSSATFGQAIETDQFLGQTWVIYWAQSS